MPDIISLNETHLYNFVPELDGFTWIGHNRAGHNRAVHKRAVKGSSGVGVFVKNTILDNFSMRIVKAYEGILFEGILFVYVLSILCHDIHL